MVLVQPEESATDEEALYFGPSIIENMTFPVRMEAFLRVGMLVKVSAVEEAQPVFIIGEVRWYPVQNYTNPVLMQVVDEVH